MLIYVADGAWLPRCVSAGTLAHAAMRVVGSKDPANAEPDNRRADSRTADAAATPLVIGLEHVTIAVGFHGHRRAVGGAGGRIGP